MTDQTVEADFDRLSQVFINLLSNALKYGDPEAPVITLTATNQPQGLAIDLHDNGPGIAPEDHERAFDKFARLAPGDLAGSAGLGLPISREIMRNLGGNLTLLETTPGTTFRISFSRSGLPRAEARAATTASG